jgi:hypothetical protein
MYRTKRRRRSGRCDLKCLRVISRVLMFFATAIVSYFSIRYGLAFFLCTRATGSRFDVSRKQNENVDRDMFLVERKMGKRDI